MSFHPKVAAVVRPLLPALVDEIIEAVGTVPAYQRPLEGDFGVGVRAGVEEALNHLVLEIEASGPVPRSDVYRRLGRGEMRAGRSLDALLSAYRVGARVTWRRVAAAGEASGLEPATLYLLAESIFAYIDVLSAESAEGYALEQTAASPARPSWRGGDWCGCWCATRRPSPRSFRRLAREAGWELPRTLAAVAIASATGRRRRSRRPRVQLPVGSDHRHDRRGDLRDRARPRRARPPCAARACRARRRGCARAWARLSRGPRRRSASCERELRSRSRSPRLRGHRTTTR